MKLDVMKTIEKFGGTGKINPKYDMGLSDLQVLRENSTGIFDLVCNSFVFGYAQGYKAAKAEKKGSAAQYE